MLLGQLNRERSHAYTYDRRAVGHSLLIVYAQLAGYHIRIGTRSVRDRRNRTGDRRRTTSSVVRLCNSMYTFPFYTVRVGFHFRDGVFTNPTRPPGPNCSPDANRIVPPTKTEAGQRLYKNHAPNLVYLPDARKIR